MEARKPSGDRKVCGDFTLGCKKGTCIKKVVDCDCAWDEQAALDLILWLQPKALATSLASALTCLSILIAAWTSLRPHLLP